MHYLGAVKSSQGKVVGKVVAWYDTWEVRNPV